MKNADQWRPSKFLLKGERLVINPDRAELGIASRLVTKVSVEMFNDHLRANARGHLLDLGCGKVPYYELYRDCVSQITCVDWPEGAHGATHVDVEADLAKPIPLPDSAFDTILCSSVLEHLPEPSLFWSELARLLSPGGNVIMNVPFLYWLHETPYDFYRHTEYALRRGAEENDLRLKILQPVGGGPVVVADNLAKTLIHLGWVGRLLARAVQASCDLFRRTPPGRWLTRQTAPKQPAVYFLIAEKPRSATDLG